MAEFTHESIKEQEEEVLQEEVLEFAPAALDDSLPEVEDPLQEINLGTEEDPRPTFISTLLKEPLKAELTALLQEFRDCFAWHYHEMLGLDRQLVEHKLPIKDGYLPVKQARRRIKTGAVRICVDYRNLNEASPKDEYPMPMADMLVDGAAHNQMLSFMDGNAGKIQPFSSLLRLKQEQTFKWEEQHQQAFQEIKHYLSNPPVLSPPKRGRPLKLYVSASEVSIGSLLVQDNKEGKEQAVYYLSRTLTEVERRYSAIERLCLALYFTAVKLRHYMLPHTIYIIAKTDLIKYMLTRPMLRGRIGKWTLALTEFTLRAHVCLNNPIYSIHLTPWKLYFDGSKTDKASGAGIVLEEPLGVRHCYSFQLDFQCTNNRAEYEALIIGLEMLVELGVQSVEILGDSMLVLKQIAGEYKCLNPSLAVYLVAARNLLTEFREATWEHIPREKNFAANELAQVASGIQMPEDCVQRIIKIGRKSLPSVLTRGMEIEVNSASITGDEWREPIMTYLRYPTLPSEKRVRIMATNYLMWNEDLVRKSKDEVLLRCLGKTEYMKVMGETHEGVCGAHQGGRKMCWLIRRYGYFWPTMMKDCIDYSKGCEACQRHGPIQQAPSVPMNPVVKPWPFRGWAMDLIGKIYPASNQQHCFIIVATDYFTKWVEAKPAESSNKVIINIIRKMLEKNPKQWHEKLSETLWAYRTSKREATGMTPYALTYGHDAILPMEIAVQSLRIAHQHGLTGEDYSQAMLLELEGLDASRIDTLNKLLAGKQALFCFYCTFKTVSGYCIKNKKQ
ncbi:uncharacterized protein LOC109950359 [Prunus persica]|uniref:uncharacterized protein LOC109950359 n=1 Tax=Prunus persica TaxID=3760 RepID=UPI0009AB2A14|nr:uncharacterized protein LOC109950359 [Prunus persica]